MLLAIVLTGCSPSIEGWVINKATKACQDHEGIDHIVNIVGFNVVCRSGNMFNINIITNQ